MSCTPALTRRHLLMSAGCLPLWSTAALASSTDLVNRRKLVLAGQQRMLTQRIARAAIFRVLEVETAQHKRMLKRAHDSFDSSLQALKSGDAELELPAETSEAALERIAEVERLWAEYGPLSKRMISAKTEQPGDSDAILVQNLPLLTASNDLVKVLVQEYGKASTEFGTAIAIDVAARQRMLTQKMAKEIGMVAMDFETEAARRQLAQTADLFVGAMGALMEGLPTITLPPPPPPILAKLEEARALWSTYEITVRFVADTGVASNYELSAIAAQSDPLLTVMNEAVLMYQEL